MEYLFDFWLEVSDYLLIFLKYGVVIGLLMASCVTVVYSVKCVRIALGVFDRFRDVVLILIPQVYVYTSHLFLNAVVRTLLSEDNFIFNEIVKKCIFAITVSPIVLVVVTLCAVGFITPIKSIISVWQKSDYRVQAIVFLEWAVSIVFVFLTSALAPSLVELLVSVDFAYDWHKVIVYGLYCVAMYLYSTRGYSSVKAEKEKKERETQVFSGEDSSMIC